MAELLGGTLHLFAANLHLRGVADPMTWSHRITCQPKNLLVLTLEEKAGHKRHFTCFTLFLPDFLNLV